MDYTILKNELINDPLDLGYQEYIDSGNHSMISTILNNKIYSGPVPIDELNSHVDTHGITHKIFNAAANASDVNLKVAAFYATRLFESRYSMIHMDYPIVIQMMQIMLAGEVLTQNEYDGIIALQNNRRSRAEVLNLNTVSHIDVATALSL